MNFSIESTLKCFTTAVLVVTFWLYICQAWLKFEKGQVALATSEVHASSILFPSITICAELKGDQVNASSVEILDGANGKIGFLVLNVTNFDLVHVQGVRRTQDKWEVKTFLNYNGFHNIWCDQIDNYSPGTMKVGARNGVSVFLDNSPLPKDYKSVFVSLSSREESATISAITHELTAFALKASPKKEDDTSLSVSARLIAFKTENVTTFDREEQPCLQHEDKELTYHECLWKYVEDIHGCSIRSQESLKTCNDSTRQTVYVELIDIVGRSSEKVFKITGCKPHCKQTHYNMIVGESQERTENPPMMPENLFAYSGPIDMLYFYVPSPMVTIKEEFKVYDLLDWAADCGGMGGILLGLSLVAGFERVLQIFNRIKRKLC